MTHAKKTEEPTEIHPGLIAVLIITALFLIPVMLATCVENSKNRKFRKLTAQAITITEGRLINDPEYIAFNNKITSLSNSPHKESSTEITKKSGRLNSDTLINGGSRRLAGEGHVLDYYEAKNNYKSNIIKIEVDWHYKRKEQGNLTYKFNVSYTMNPPLKYGEEAFLDVNPWYYTSNNHHLYFHTPSVVKVVYEDGSIELESGSSQREIRELEDLRLRHVRGVLSDVHDELGITSGDFGGWVPTWDLDEPAKTIVDNLKVDGGGIERSGISVH